MTYYDRVGTTLKGGACTRIGSGAYYHTTCDIQPSVSPHLTTALSAEIRRPLVAILQLAIPQQQRLPKVGGG